MPSLALSVSELSIADTAGSTAVFDVISNSAWMVKCPETWLNVNPQGGINNKTITVTAEANTETTTRSTIITVSTPGLPEDTVEVTQEGTEPYLILWGPDFQVISELSIGAGEGSTNFFFALTNATAEFSSSEEWLTFTTTYNSTWLFYTINLTAEKNPELVTRQAVVTITISGLDPQIVIVTQAAGSTSRKDEIVNNNSIVYPNPSTDKLVINIPGKPAKITLLTTEGKKLTALNTSSSVTEIDISHFSPGIYLLQIESAEQVIVKKIIKQ